MNARTIRHLVTAAGLGAAVAFGAAIAGSTLASPDAAQGASAGRADDRYERRDDAYASRRDDGTPQGLAPGAGLAAGDIVARLQEQGYDGVREMEHENGRWEVDARDRDGRPVELYVDPATGEVLRVDYD